jgi:hypothetical protein
VIRALLRVVVGAALVAPALSAQQVTTDVVSEMPHPSCVDSLSPTAFRPTLVYVESDVDDAVGATSALIAGMDLLVEGVAGETRALLGAADGALPVADSVVAWGGLAPGVEITVHRDGHFTWRTVWPRVRTDEARSDDAARLISRALEVISRRDEPFLWDAEASVDSVTWTLRLALGQISSSGEVTPPEEMRMGFPAFTVHYPAMENVRVRHAQNPRYPADLQLQGFSGSVTIEFLVDTTGHAVPGSLRDSWPKGRARLAGDGGRAYAQFVAAARESVRRSTYVPARLGGCPVIETVRQPFVFQLTEHFRRI